MSRFVTNVARRKAWRSLGVLAMIGAIPLAAVGFSVRPGLRWAAIDSELKALAESVCELPDGGNMEALKEARSQLERHGAALSELETSLDGLVPYGCDLIELFDEVRRAARGAKIQLQSLSPGMTLALDSGQQAVGPLPDDALHATELALLGTCDLEQLSDFVRRLRAAANPTEVRALNLARENDFSDRFRFQLTLGMLHRGDAAFEAAIRPTTGSAQSPANDSRSTLR